MCIYTTRTHTLTRTHARTAVSPSFGCVHASSDAVTWKVYSVPSSNTNVPHGSPSEASSDHLNSAIPFPVLSTLPHTQKLSLTVRKIHSTPHMRTLAFNSLHLHRLVKHDLWTLTECSTHWMHILSNGKLWAQVSTCGSQRSSRVCRICGRGAVIFSICIANQKKSNGNTHLVFSHYRLLVSEPKRKGTNKKNIMSAFLWKKGWINDQTVNCIVRSASQIT